MPEESRPKVVIVNDVRFQLEATRVILKKMDLDIHLFESAESSLEYMRETGAPDVIITDLHMPGIDGWRFCRLLRSEEYADFNDVPILVFSATFSGADAEHITKDLGANAFLSVPYDVETFRSFVDALLKGKNPHQNPRVLIVDANEFLAKHMERAFQADGYETKKVSSGEHARQHFLKQHPGTVVIDYHLPDCSGEELLVEFKNTAFPPICILITADTSPELALNLMKKGADGYILKPFNYQYLIDLCRRVQRERSLLNVELILEKRSEELRKVEEKHRVMIENSRDLIWSYDLRESAFSFFSKAVTPILGYPEAKIRDSMNRKLEDVFPAEEVERVRKTFNEAIVRPGSDKHVSLEAPHLHADGHLVWLEISGTVIHDANGRAIAVSGVSRDITLRQQAEQERFSLNERLKDIQRLESLANMAGGIAHDFNNLLTGIIGNASLALMDLPLNTDAAGFLKEIDRSAQKATDLAKQMLAYSGRGHFVLRPLNLSTILAQMKELLSSVLTDTAQINYPMSESAAEIEGDKLQLEQVVVNLVQNSVEAIASSGGDITITTGIMHCDRNFLATTIMDDHLPEGQYGYFRVEDTGCGMDDSAMEKIFDPFFSSKFVGRGLGLAAVLGIVRGHRGAVSVTSEKNKGSTFLVLLPLAEKKSIQADVTLRQRKRPKGGGELILVAEDEEVVMNVVQRTLENSGYRILKATDGFEARDKYQEHSSEIDMVILDLTMPRMTGEQVFDELLKINENVCVLMSSGYNEEEVVKSFSNRGLAGFIQKPYLPADLLDKIQSILHSK